MTINAFASRPSPLVFQSASSAPTIAKAAGFSAAASTQAIEDITQQVIALLQRMDGKGSASVPATSTMAVTLRSPDLARLQQHVAAGGENALSPEATLTALLGQLMQTVDDSGLDRLRQRLASHRSALAGRQLQAERLSAAQQKALAELGAADAGMQSALTDAEQARDLVQRQRGEIDTYDQILKDLAADHPDRPAVEAARAAAVVALATAEQRLQQAADKVLAAGTVVDQATTRLNAVMGTVSQFNAGSVLRVEEPEVHRTASAKLRELLARLSIVMSDHSLEKLKNDSDMLMEQLKARDADNIERARKHAEEQERARDAEKKTGCAGKIFGWIKTALATVASVVVVTLGVLTANPLMVAGGVMALALTVDYAVQLATGFSVVGKLTEFVGKGIAAVLKSYGVDGKLADTIGNIAATIAVTVAIIAASIATANAAGAMQGVTNAVNMAQRIAMVMQVIGQVAGLAGDITRAAGQVIVANIMVTIAELMAAIERHLFDSDTIRDMLEKVGDAAASIDRTALDLIRQMGQVTQEQTATFKQVLHNFKHTA